MDSQRPYHKKYTLSDIEQYLKGTLSPAQMHEMERAALQDPFLADALEGYTEQPMDVSRAHLAHINAQLSGDQNNKGPIIVPIRRKPWVWPSVAAVCILLAGTAVYFLSGTEEKQANSIAINSTVNKLNESPATEIINHPTDSTPQHPVIVAATKPIISIPPAPPPAFSPSPTVEETSMKSLDSLHEKLLLAAAGARKEMNEEQSLTASTLRTSPDTPHRVGLALLKEQPGVNEISGKILDADSMPVANAVISQLTTNDQPRLTDQKGQFTLISKDSAIPVKINSIGYNEAISYVYRNNPNQIILNKNNQRLNEVAVSALNAQSKRSETGIVHNRQMISHELIPAIGTQALLDTLNKIKSAYQLSATQTAKANQVSPKLTVSFELDNHGMVKQIHVPSHTHPELITRILSILTQAGPWTKKGKTATGTYEITF